MRTISIAVLALLGKVSAEQLKHKSIGFQEYHVDEFGFIVLGQETVLRKESDELANGDAADDKEIQDEHDGEDDIVQDEGFAGKRHHLYAQLNKESDELANGDAADDKEIQDEHDGEDDIVQDEGFAGKRHHLYAQLDNKVRRHKKGHYHFSQRYSDELANGDAADDKEVQDEHDPEDPIVQDEGFAGKRHHLYVQKKHHNKHKKSHYHFSQKESDELANGDAADDKEIQDEHDGEDDIVQDEGFAGKRHHLYAQKNQKQHKKGHYHFGQQPRYSDEIANGDAADDKAVDRDEVSLRKQRIKNYLQVAKESDELANGDAADDKEIQDEHDGEDDIVQDEGFAGKRHHLYVQRYSDEVANGDAADDKEIQDEHDGEDDIVQDEGFAGKRHHLYAQKKVHKKHHKQYIMTKKESDELANGDAADDKEIQDEHDGEDDIVQDEGFAGKRHHLYVMTQKESDDIANADAADDKEVEDEWDGDDDVVQDTGFARNWVQVGSKVQLKKESDDIANADAADDKEVEDEWDGDDDVVQDTGFARNWLQLDSQISKKHKKHHKHHSAPEQNLIQLDEENEGGKGHKDGPGHFWSAIQQLNKQSTEQSLVQLDEEGPKGAAPHWGKIQSMAEDAQEFNAVLYGDHLRVQI